MADAQDPWAAFNPQPAPSGPVYGAPPKPASPPSGFAPVNSRVTPVAPIPGGPADPMRMAPPPQGYRYANDGKALEPIPGGPADQTVESALDPKTATFYAQQLLAGGQMPALGMGKQAAQARQEIMRQVAEQAGARGLSGADLARQIAHYKAGTQQLTQLEKMLGYIQSSEETALLNGQQFLDRSSELPGQTEIPIVNTVVQGVQRALPVPGHDTVAAMDAAWNTFNNEYAKVIGGSPTGAGTLTDSARHEAMSIMRGNYSLSQKEAAFEQMKADMANRIAAIHSGLNDAYANLTQQPGYAVPDTTAALIAAAKGEVGDVSQPGARPPGMGGGTSGTGGGGGSGPTPPAPNMPSDQLTPATGGTKEVYDSSMTPIRQEYMARLQAGQSGTQLVGFLRNAGFSDPALLQSAAQQAAFRRQHPDIPITAYNTAAIDHHVQQMGGLNQAINKVGQAAGPATAAVAAAGNSALAGFGPEVTGLLGANPEQARVVLDHLAQQNPGATLTGDIAGGTLAALGGEAALGGAGVAPSFGRSLLADTGYGAVAGAGSSPDNRTAGAIEGGLAGAGGSVVGQGLAKGASAALRGVTNADVGALAANGVNSLTPGQIVANSGRAGQLVKGIEDRLSGFAGPGTMINARRAEGYRQFNSAAFDQALKPIGGSVKGAVGEDAMSAASDQVSQAFNAALKGKTAVPDAEFINQARGPLERLAANKRVGPEIVDSIEQATQGLFDDQTGALAGEHMQAFLQALRQIRQGYRNDPLYQTTIKPSIQGLENAVEGMFQRQAPEVMPAFNKAKQAYRRVSILADAVDKGKNTEGVFTPGQLGMADRANAKKFDGKISAASGDSPFFDLQRAAQNVLPSKVPDSGTAGRLAVMGGASSLTGAGAGLGYLTGDTKTGAETGLGLTALLAAAYTRAGNKRLAQLLLSRSPAARAIAEKIAGRAPIAGAAGTALMLPAPSNQ